MSEDEIKRKWGGENPRNQHMENNVDGKKAKANETKAEDNGTGLVEAAKVKMRPGLSSYTGSDLETQKSTLNFIANLAVRSHGSACFQYSGSI